jgi:hypothetical protein
MPISRLPELNWRRGIAEVALIFVGITLALLFDNWNEARKARILEEQLFAALRADLLETRADLVTDPKRPVLPDWLDRAVGHHCAVTRG